LSLLLVGDIHNAIPQQGLIWHWNYHDKVIIRWYGWGADYN